MLKIPHRRKVVYSIMGYTLESERLDMCKKISELEKQIAEKNSLLDSLEHEKTGDKEIVKKTKLELDKLLYMYYKSLKSRFAAQVFFFM